MFVVAAKHRLSRIFTEQRIQRIEVPRRGPFPNRNLATGRELVERFVFCKTFVIGCDSSRDVLSCLLAAQPWCVSVDWLASIVRCLYLRQTARVAIQNAREVHHLPEIQNARVFE